MSVPCRLPVISRAVLAVTVTAAVVSLVGATGAAASPAPDTVVGRLVQVWVEHGSRAGAAAGNADAPTSWIEPTTGRAVRVPTDDVADLEPGATVEVALGKKVPDGTAADGLQPAREVLSAETMRQPDPVAQAVPTARTTNHVTVAMVVPAGGAPDSTSLTDVVATVNGAVADYYAEQTNTAIDVVVTAQFDWPSLPYAASCSDPVALWDEAQAKTGFVPGPKQNLLLYVPADAPGCAYEAADVGAGVESGGRLYVTDPSAAAIAHGLGHNFGLGHSSTQQCAASVESGSCRVVDGGDYYDVMGAPWGEMGPLNAAQRVALGYMAADQYFTVRPGDYFNRDIYPAGLVGYSHAYRAVKLIGAYGSVYWLEYRAPGGRDAWLGDGRNTPGVDSGLVVWREPDERDSTDGYDTSLQLDGTPSSAAGWDADRQVAFPVGVPVSLSGAEFTLTVLSVGPSLTFRVDGVTGDTACATRSSIPTAGVALLSSGGTTSALVVGQDRGLWQRPIDGASTWTSLGGGVTYGPAAATSGSTSYVFVIGLGGDLWYRASTGSGWGPWTGLGGYLTASPAAASLGAGQVRVFGRGITGALWSRELINGTWSGWTSHGGYLGSAPTATADPGTGRLDVVVRGSDGYSYSQSLTAGSGAAPYERVGVIACSAFTMGTVRSTADPRQGVFLDSRGTPTLYSFGFPQSLGGAFTSAPAAQFSGSDFVVAGRGTDNALWLFDGRAGNGWRWRSLGGYIR